MTDSYNEPDPDYRGYDRPDHWQGDYQPDHGRPGGHQYARGRGRNYWAGRDVNHDESHNYFWPLLRSTVPGLLLIWLGSGIGVLAFAGWMSIIFRAAGSEGGTGFGPTLPSGIPLAVFYFLGFGAGGLMAAIGGGMRRAAGTGRGAVVVGHALVAAIVAIAAVVAVQQVTAGVPYRYLLPRFASCPTEPHQDSPRSQPPPRGGQFSQVTMEQWACVRKLR